MDLNVNYRVNLVLCLNMLVSDMNRAEAYKNIPCCEHQTIRQGQCARLNDRDSVISRMLSISLSTEYL